MDGNLRADVDAPTRSQTRGQNAGGVVSQISLPLGHLNSMFTLSLFLAATLLIGGASSFFRSTDIEAQPLRHAQYQVNLNSGRWVEFANLPSIGKKTAQSIVEYGQAIGGYRSINQLLEVKGVGEKTFARIRPYIVLVNSNVASEHSELPKL